jgi:hypothetical protein
MNNANYKKWLQEKLIPNLESKSVAVVDSVPDHNVLISGTQPTVPEKLKCCSGWKNTAPT